MRLRVQCAGEIIRRMTARVTFVAIAWEEESFMLLTVKVKVYEGTLCMHFIGSEKYLSLIF